MKPEKIKINNLTWQVSIVDPTDDRLFYEDSRRVGITRGRTQEVFVSNDLSVAFFKQVLLHELTHAFCVSYGLMQIDWNEETVADFVETHLVNIYAVYDKLLQKFIKEE